MSTELAREDVQKTYGLTPEQMERLNDFQIKQIGQLDHDTLESMLVGYFTLNLADERGLLFTTYNANLITDSGILGSWFTNEALGVIYDDVKTYYRARRKLATIDEIGEHLLSLGYTGDKALQYKSYLHKCAGAVMARRISPDILIKRMTNQHYCKVADDVIGKFVKDRINPQVGPESAINQFREACIRKLSRSESGPIREFSLVKDFKADIAWALDRKKYPEKYRGLECKIKVIDEKTTGFHPGHLTVFVGAHGGYKSTFMMNVGYGLWRNGANVLYVSLEMAATLVKTRMWCRTTADLPEQNGVPWYRLNRGEITEPGDQERYEYLSALIINEAEFKKVEEKQREKLVKEHASLYRALNDAQFPTQKGSEDTVLMERAYQEVEKYPNEYRFINVGMSEKIKVSQIERYIEDHTESWKPDVVIIDYLALVASDVAYPDRRDLEVGDVCKAFRKMGDKLGFAVVSAAQYKRAAIDRLRKHGFTEKAELGTDDLAESNQIGADADTIFMLWREQGKEVLTLMTPKARHTGKDTEHPVSLNIKPEVCMVSDNIQNTAFTSRNADVAMMRAAESKVKDIKTAVQQKEGDVFEEFSSGGGGDEIQGPAEPDYFDGGF